MASEVNRSVMALAIGALLGGAIAAVPARAQESSPQNVNDCTFLSDPIRVRQCVESFQGSVQTPDIAPYSPTPPPFTPPATAPVAPPPPQQAPPPRLAPQ